MASRDTGMPPFGSITARFIDHPASATRIPVRRHPTWLMALTTSQAATTAWLPRTSSCSNGSRDAANCNPAARNGRAGRRMPELVGVRASGS